MALQMHGGLSPHGAMACLVGALPLHRARDDASRAPHCPVTEGLAAPTVLSQPEATSEMPRTRQLQVPGHRGPRVSAHVALARGTLLSVPFSGCSGSLTRCADRV